MSNFNSVTFSARYLKKKFFFLLWIKLTPVECLNIIITKFDLHGKDIKVIRNLDLGQIAFMQIGKIFKEYTKIKRRVRHGCGFSPDLFNLYIEKILRELEFLAGFVIGGITT